MTPRMVRIDGFAVPAHGPDDGDAPTLRQLLAHTSGAELELFPGHDNGFLEVLPGLATAYGGAPVS